MAHVMHSGEVSVPGMTAERVALEPGGTARHAAVGGEAMAYVVGGQGVVRIAGEETVLAVESVIWLAGDEEAIVEAGADGLELLLARTQH